MPCAKALGKYKIMWLYNVDTCKLEGEREREKELRKEGGL